jgi:hypothetical protein
VPMVSAASTAAVDSIRWQTIAVPPLQVG